jgi:tRNA dimethylallyltransferase
MKTVIIITGPTASGKAGLAHLIAKNIGSEIIMADSMKVYREADIATSKPQKSYQEEVKYHLIDIIDPFDRYDVGSFYRDSCTIIDGLHKVSKVPVVCGGTALYISKLTDGIADMPVIPDDLTEELMVLPVEDLYEQLKTVDPERARELHPNMKIRIVRALGVYKCTGKKMSDLMLCTKPPDYNCILIGINWDRRVLYERINKRVDNMVNDGLIEEVDRLYGKYGPEAPVFQGVGYKQFLTYFKKESNLKETIEEVKKATRNYAKRQLTWWRSKELIWLDGEKLATSNKKSRKISFK